MHFNLLNSCPCFRTVRLIRSLAAVGSRPQLYCHIFLLVATINVGPVSYTHLDVYKRQPFALRTVTYGTASASFLATRCLIQIGRDHQASFPDAALAIINDFYVDDLLTGADTISDLTRLKSDLGALLSQYSFTLHKWACSESRVVASHDNLSLPLNKQDNVRTLGILWNNTADSFLFDIKTFPVESSISKRRILSIIAGIYLSLIHI